MDVDELNIDKLKTVPIDLKELSDVVEKDMHSELVKRVCAIDSDKQNLERRIEKADKIYLIPVNLL